MQAEGSVASFYFIMIGFSKGKTGENTTGDTKQFGGTRTTSFFFGDSL